MLGRRNETFHTTSAKGSARVSLQRRVRFDVRYSARHSLHEFFLRTSSACILSERSLALCRSASSAVLRSRAPSLSVRSQRATRSEAERARDRLRQRQEKRTTRCSRGLFLLPKAGKKRPLRKAGEGHLLRLLPSSSSSSSSSWERGEKLDESLIVFFSRRRSVDSACKVSVSLPESSEVRELGAPPPCPTKGRFTCVFAKHRDSLRELERSSSRVGSTVSPESSGRPIRLLKSPPFERSQRSSSNARDQSHTHTLSLQSGPIPPEFSYIKSDTERAQQQTFRRHLRLNERDAICLSYLL